MENNAAAMREDLWRTLQVVSEWIKVADTKAGACVAIDGDLLALLEQLPPELREDLAALWDEYERATSPEAKLAKALDKLETIMQHTQGRNPPEFDYRFNLGYGRTHTADHPLIVAIRAILDEDTERRAQEAEGIRSTGAASSE
jgi:hypothetical protein